MAAVAESTPCRRHLRLPAATSRCLDSLSTALTKSDAVLSSSKRVDSSYFFPLSFLSFFFLMSKRSYGTWGIEFKIKKKRI